MNSLADNKLECIEDADSTDQMLACRACLTTECKLFDLHENQLTETYMDLTALPISSTDGLPQHICTYCKTSLQKYAAFRNRCRIAHKILEQTKIDRQDLTTELIKNIDKSNFESHLNTKKLESIDVESTETKLINIENLETPLEIFNEEIIKSESEVKLKDDLPTFDIITNEELNNKNYLKIEVENLGFGFENDSMDSDDFILKIDRKALENETCGINNKKRKLSKKIDKALKTSHKNSKKDTHRHKTKTKAVTNDLSAQNNTETLEELRKSIKKDPDSDLLNINTDIESEDCNVALKDTVKLKRSKIKLKKSSQDYFIQNCTNLVKDINVRVVFFTKEEQVKEVQLRKESPSYINARYKCELCFKGVMTQGAFRNHMLVHDSSTGSFVCELCHIRFPKKYRLDRHLATHAVHYVCNECDATLKTTWEAKDHYKWHAGVQYVCEFCSKAFRKKSSHMNHVRTQHASSTCELCGDTFVGAHGLRAHLNKAHREAVNSNCDACRVQFHSGDAMRAHVLAGCSDDMRPCAQCGLSFTSEDLLNEHLVKQHGKRDYECDKCRSTYATEKQYRLHRYRAHNKFTRGGNVDSERYSNRKRHHVVCETCGKMCQSGAALRTHQLVHTGEKPHQCPACPKTFRLVLSLENHMNTHTGERPYQCPQCPKAFKTYPGRKRHLLVHTKERRHQCHLCDKTFQTSTCVKTHIKTVHMKLPAPPRARPRGKREYPQ